MFTCTITYRDDKPDQTMYPDLPQAVAYAREECHWENTERAVITNSNGLVKFDLDGDFS